MLPGWVIFASAFGYLLLLFAVASYGDRKNRARATCPGTRAQAGGLCAEPCDLLHLLDLFRQRRACGAARAGICRHLYRPDPGLHARHAAASPHHRACQGREAHLGCRFRRRALRQEPDGRDDRRADLADRRHSLYRAAAQGDLEHRQRHGQSVRLRHRQRQSLFPRPAAARDAGACLLRHHVRHAAYGCDGTSGWPDPRRLDGIRGQARRLPDGRRLRHLVSVRRSDRSLAQDRRQRAGHVGAQLPYADQPLDHADRLVGLCDHHAAAAIPRDGCRKPNPETAETRRLPVSRSISSPSISSCCRWRSAGC